VGSAVIPVARAKRIVALLGEAGEIGPGSEDARRHVVTRVLDLVGAACGAVVRDSAHRPGGRNGALHVAGRPFTPRA
jgi:hypothetical protein